MMISQGFFLIFSEIFIFGAVRGGGGGGVEGQKMPKMKSSSYISHAPYLRNSIAYDHDFWYTSVK